MSCLTLDDGQQPPPVPPRPSSRQSPQLRNFLRPGKPLSTIESSYASDVPNSHYDHD